MIEGQVSDVHSALLVLCIVKSLQSMKERRQVVMKALALMISARYAMQLVQVQNSKPMLKQASQSLTIYLRQWHSLIGQL